MLRKVILFGAIALIAACSGKTGEYAGRGAATGAMSGAVGGLFGALVFGGDPIEAAARGAVVGTAVGATAGAVTGSEADRRIAEQQQADLDAIRREIGDDSFDGLVALTDCRHDVALSHAAKAVQSDNSDYVLAGYWLEALTYTDQRQEAAARASYPALIERDPNIASSEQAELKMREFIQDLTAIRGEYGLPQVCAT